MPCLSDRLTMIAQTSTQSSAWSWRQTDSCRPWTIIAILSFHLHFRQSMSCSIWFNYDSGFIILHIKNSAKGEILERDTHFQALCDLKTYLIGVLKSLIWLVYRIESVLIATASLSSRHLLKYWNRQSKNIYSTDSLYSPLSIRLCTLQDSNHGVIELCFQFFSSPDPIAKVTVTQRVIVSIGISIDLILRWEIVIWPVPK